jgi:hypothetical protein
VHDPRLDGIDVRCEVLDEVVLGQPALTAFVDDDVRESPWLRAAGTQSVDRLGLVEPERGDVDEPGDVPDVRAERGHDLPAVGMAYDDCRSVDPGERLA